MHLIIRIINFALELFDLALLIYVIISWLKPASNQWIELLRRIVEPVLTPIRRILVAKLPARWQIVDWSPVAAWLLIAIIQRLLAILW